MRNIHNETFLNDVLTLSGRGLIYVNWIWKKKKKT